MKIKTQVFGFKADKAFPKKLRECAGPCKCGAWPSWSLPNGGKPPNGVQLLLNVTDPVSRLFLNSINEKK